MSIDDCARKECSLLRIVSRYCRNIARVRNCPDITILNSLPLCMLYLQKIGTSRISNMTLTVTTRITRFTFNVHQDHLIHQDHQIHQIRQNCQVYQNHQIYQIHQNGQFHQNYQLHQNHQINQIHQIPQNHMNHKIHQCTRFTRGYGWVKGRSDFFSRSSYKFGNTGVPKALSKG